VAVTRRPSRARFLLLVLVLAAVTLVTLNQRGGSGTLGSVRARVQDVTAPVQRGIHTALQPIGNFLTGAADYGKLEKENDRLRQQVAAMQNQSISAEAAEAQAQRVLEEQHLPFVGDIKTVTAEVIDDDPSNFENTVTIDKGTSSGLAVGQPVVVTEGLAGSIGAVTSGTAVVRLLTDPDFVVGVRLGSVVGSADGFGRGQAMRVTFDQPTVSGSTLGSGSGTGGTTFSLTKGTNVVTSGLDLETFPAGIPVAKVATFSNPPDAAAPTVTLTPLVDLSRLDFVQVELWSPQTAGG
jgi:rod shape-determining protein MreC